MAVSTSYAPLTYSGNGVTTAFSVTWSFFTGSLVVTAIDATGVETVKTITTHYTVSGGTDANGLPATGTVTMLTAPASSTSLRITRSTPKTQATVYTNGDAFPAKTHETALDKALLIAQELANVYDGVTGDFLTLDSSGATDFWDAESHKIRSVTDGTDDTDAATVAQLNAATLGSLTAVTLTQYIDLTENASPGTPSANNGRLYTRDDGAGLTELTGLDSAGNALGIDMRLADASAVLGSAAKFWYPDYLGNAGTGIVHRLNRLLVGAAALGSSDNPMDTEDWLEALISDTTVYATLAGNSPIGGLGVIGASRSSDYRTWAGAAAGGAQGVSGFGYNNDTTGAPIVCGIFGMALHAASVTGVTEHELTVGSAATPVDITPFGGVVGGNTLGLNISAGYTGFTQNISCALTFDSSVTAKFRKGLVVQSDAIDTSVGASGSGVAIELARSQEMRWLNSGGTVDTSIWSSVAGLHVNSALMPAADDGGALGATTLNWSDLFGASGFVWNIANGNWIATHTAGILTVGTGDLRVTTAGTDTASVVTVGGTQTLTAKTLTTPDINGGTADSLTSLSVRSTGAAFDLTLATAEALSAGRTLSWIMGDAARTITLSGNPTLNDWFDQSVKVAASPTFAAVTAAALNVGAAPVGLLSVHLTAVNFNSANTDNAATIVLPTGYTRYRLQNVAISGASASITTATIGVFTDAAAGGTTMAANQAITVSTASENTNNNGMTLTLTNNATTNFNDTAIFVRIGTAQGSAATANVTISYFPLP